MYLLYHTIVFDSMERTLFCNVGVPGATSQDVLDHQVPQAVFKFHPTVITISVGGNDLLPLAKGAELRPVLNTFRKNLSDILRRLRAGLPQAQIYLSNLYSIPKIKETEAIVPLVNRVISNVTRAFAVPVADVYRGFRGRTGLLQIECDNAPPDEIHPTNAGYRAMAQAFEEVARRRSY